MARRSKPSESKPSGRTPRRGAPVRALRRLLRRWVWRALLASVAVICLAVSLFAVVNPPTTLYIAAESGRLGGVERTWVDIDDIAPVMVRSVVAAEDANFCLHWGFDMQAIRQVIEEGETRGASTLSQQVVKNVYLWPARSWARKALEAIITPVMELVWPKRRILEVYLNVAEFDEGVFGVGAAAAHYFGTSADMLTAQEAARLAAVLPNPKGRSASRPGQFVQRRAASIMDGAETIRRDGRADCFED